MEPSKAICTSVMRGHLPVFSGSIGAATGGSSCVAWSVPRTSPSSAGWAFSRVRRGLVSLSFHRPRRQQPSTSASRPDHVHVSSRLLSIGSHTGGSWLLSALVSWSSRSSSSLFSVRSMCSCFCGKISGWNLASPLTQDVHVGRFVASRKQAPQAPVRTWWAARTGASAQRTAP